MLRYVGRFFGQFDDFAFRFEDVLYFKKAVSAIAGGQTAGGSQTHGTYLTCQSQDAGAGLVGLVHITLFFQYFTDIKLHVFMYFGGLLQKGFRGPFQNGLMPRT